jgi:hypothetical protein
VGVHVERVQTGDLPAHPFEPGQDAFVRDHGRGD